MTTTIPTPKLLPVVVGTITIEKSILDVSSLDELDKTLATLRVLLALIPQRDKDEAETDEYYIHITTDNQEALEFAHKNYFLDDLCTCIDTLLGTYADGRDEAAVDEIVDLNTERDFDIEALEKGLYIVFKN